MFSRIRRIVARKRLAQERNSNKKKETRNGTVIEEKPKSSFRDRGFSLGNDPFGKYLTDTEHSNVSFHLSSFHRRALRDTWQRIGRLSSNSGRGKVSLMQLTLTRMQLKDERLRCIFHKAAVLKGCGKAVTSNDHAHIIALWIDLIMHKLKDGPNVQVPIPGASEHGRLKTIGFKSFQWETFGEALCEIIFIQHCVRTYPDAIPAWRIFIAHLVDVMRVNFDKYYKDQKPDVQLNDLRERRKKFITFKHDTLDYPNRERFVGAPQSLRMLRQSGTKLLSKLTKSATVPGSEGRGLSSSAPQTSRPLTPDSLRSSRCALEIEHLVSSSDSSGPLGEMSPIEQKLTSSRSAPEKMSCSLSGRRNPALHHMPKEGWYGNQGHPLAQIRQESTSPSSIEAYSPPRRKQTAITASTSAPESFYPQSARDPYHSGYMHGPYINLYAMAVPFAAVPLRAFANMNLDPRQRQPWNDCFPCSFPLQYAPAPYQFRPYAPVPE